MSEFHALVRFCKSAVDWLSMHYPAKFAVVIVRPKTWTPDSKPTPCDIVVVAGVGKRTRLDQLDQWWATNLRTAAGILEAKNGAPGPDWSDTTGQTSD